MVRRLSSTRLMGTRFLLILVLPYILPSSFVICRYPPWAVLSYCALLSSCAVLSHQRFLLYHNVPRYRTEAFYHTVPCYLPVRCSSYSLKESRISPGLSRELWYSVRWFALEEPRADVPGTPPGIATVGSNHSTHHRSSRCGTCRRRRASPLRCIPRIDPLHPGRHHWRWRMKKGFRCGLWELPRRFGWLY